MWSLKASPRGLQEEFLIFTLSQDKVNVIVSYHIAVISGTIIFHLMKNI